MTDSQVYDLLSRWYKLKRLKIPLPPLWTDFYVEKTRFTEREVWKLYTLADEGLGPHGERIYLTVEQLKEIVENAEREHVGRKPPGRDGEVPPVWRQTRLG